eukprot:1532076-Rhodomonas_salina.1
MRAYGGTRQGDSHELRVRFWEGHTGQRQCYNPAGLSSDLFCWLIYLLLSVVTVEGREASKSARKGCQKEILKSGSCGTWTCRRTDSTEHAARSPFPSTARPSGTKRFPPKRRMRWRWRKSSDVFSSPRSANSMTRNLRAGTLCTAAPGVLRLVPPGKPRAGGRWRRPSASRRRYLA